MKRTKDDFRALLDLMDLKLKDQDSMMETVRLSLSNSFSFNLQKLHPTYLGLGDDLDELLSTCANEALTERRRKLDHEIYLLLQQRYQLSPGNLRESFDDCWSECLSNSIKAYKIAKNIQPISPSIKIMAFIMSPVISLSAMACDPELVIVVSGAWKDYLQGIRRIVAKEWEMAFCD